MQHCELMFQGERLRALQHGALHWPRKRLLGVAGLHMGKSARMARTGSDLHPLLRGQRGPKCCDLCRKRGLPVGSGVVENPCKHIVENRFKKSGSAGRKRAPTPCSPPYPASKTCVGPTSSIGGLVAPQPPDQKMGCTRVLAVSLQRSEKHATC